MKALAATYRFGKFTLQTGDRRLSSDGHEIYLRPKTYDTLLYLLERQGHLVTKKELLDTLWNDVEVTENALTRCVKEVRAALEDDVQNPAFLRTIPRLGYEFMADVERLDEPTNGQAVEEEFQAVRLVTTEEESDNRPSEPVWAEDNAAVSGAQPSLPPKAPHRRTVAVRALVGALAVAGLVAGLAALKQSVFRRPAASPDTAIIHSLAVLPLANLSGDPGQEYFADGMTEALITELGKFHSLRVISRQSVMHYKGSNKTVLQIAQELNVDAVVEGSAVRAGGKVWITAQLIQAAPERHVWSESYERKLSDVIALQRELSQAIVGEIQGKLASPERAHLINAPAVKPEAYEDYLRGRYHFERRTGRLGVDEAISYFRQAVAKDASYAPAYAWLARCYAISGLYHPPKEVLPKARAAAMKALEIDDTQAEAHASLGFVKAAYDWDWQGAEREFNRAIELDPNNSSSHSQYVWYLGVMGRFDEAIAEAKSARVLDPFSVNTNRILGWAYLHARRYDEAVDQFKKTLELDPNYSPAQIYLADCYLLKGMYPEALAQLQRLRPRSDAWLAYLYGVTGQRGKALAVIKDMKHQQYMDPIFLVIAYAGLGDRDNAIRLLNKGYAERSPQMPFLKVEPFLDPLRSDQRFQELVVRMNLPQN